MDDHDLDLFLSRNMPLEEDRLIRQNPIVPEKAHTFSKRFERRMKKLLRRARWEEKQQKRSPAARRFVLFGRRAAAVLLIAIVTLTILIVSVEAVRQQFFRMIQIISPKYSTIRYEQVDSSIHLPDELIEYELTYLPEGFQLVEDTRMWNAHYLTYENAEDEKLYISFEQERLDFVNADINTEFAVLETIPFKGDTAHFLAYGGAYLIMWEDNYYSYCVITLLDRETTIKIADGVKRKI